MRACVIGAGVVGCSVALELRRVGFDVTVVDRNGDAGHGSTSASCGIVRRFYSQPGMVAMAQEASFIWADWGNYLGPVDDDKAVFHRPGMLYIPPKIDDTIRGIVHEMTRLAIPVDLLTADEVARAFPYFSLDSQYPPRALDDDAFFESAGTTIEGAVFERDAGYVVSPGLATLNLRQACERDGVRFQMNREVIGIEPRDAGGFRIVLANGEADEFDVTVNVGGPHSSKINKLAGVTLPLETRALRREVHAVANPLYVEGAPSGGVPVVGDLNGGVYFRPESGGRDLIVGTTDPACDPTEWVDPDDYDDDRLNEDYRQRQCLRAMKRFPDVRLGPPRGVTSMYDVTVQDWYPIADRTDQPGYYVCIGTSGSSFKTAPVLGRLMAEIIDASESGRNVDSSPIQLVLERAGTTVDTRFLSRLRGVISSTGTVIG